MMRPRFKKTKKKLLAFVAIFMALSVMLITVNAWEASTSTSVVIKGAEAEVQAAFFAVEKIEQTNSPLGIPGETIKYEYEITVNSNSNRDFAWRIELLNANDQGDFVFYDDKGYALGTLDFGQVGNTSNATKIYGVWKPGDDAKIKFDLNVNYYGEEVIDMGIVNPIYDGNKTQGNGFTLTAKMLTMTYCQATDKAVMDVFGISLTDAAKGGP